MTPERYPPKHSVRRSGFNDDGLSILVERRSDVEGVKDHRDVCEERGVREMPSWTYPMGRPSANGSINDRSYSKTRSPSAVSKGEARRITNAWVKLSVLNKAIRDKTLGLRIGLGVV